jgi:hypothetical protein
MNSLCLAVDTMTTQEDYDEKLAKIEVQKVGKPTMKSFDYCPQVEDNTVSRRHNLWAHGTDL